MQIHEQSSRGPARVRAGWEPQDTSEEVFGRRVREERLRLSITQGGLANALLEQGIKLDPTAITRLEKGNRAVGLNEALAIAQALGCTLDHLLDPWPTPDLAEQIRQVEVAHAEVEREIDALLEARETLDRQREDIEYRTNELLDRSRMLAARIDQLQTERDRAQMPDPSDG